MPPRLCLLELGLHFRRRSLGWCRRALGGFWCSWISGSGEFLLPWVAAVAMAVAARCGDLVLPPRRRPAVVSSSAGRGCVRWCVGGGGLLVQVCSSGSWWLGAWFAVGGGGFGCSPSTLSSGGDEARIREVRGVSPAGVPQRLRLRRRWRVALEVHKARFAMALSRCLGCWIFVWVSSGGRSCGGGGWLRRAVRWMSKRTHKDFVVFSFFLGTFLLLFLVFGVSGLFQREYTWCNLFVVPLV
jgi:hypothetical protein